MPHISRTLATISKEIGDYIPVFYDAFAWSSQKSETLWHDFGHAHRKWWFIVCKGDQSAFLFFTICGWKQEDIFLMIITIFYIQGQTGIVQVRGVFLSVALDAISTTGRSTAFFHTRHLINTKWKFLTGALRIIFFGLYWFELKIIVCGFKI